jgi:hypothetical protein
MNIGYSPVLNMQNGVPITIADLLIRLESYLEEAKRLRLLQAISKHGDVDDVVSMIVKMRGAIDDTMEATFPVIAPDESDNSTEPVPMAPPLDEPES